MAVYTVFDREDIIAITKKYELVLYSFEGIKEGILNTNYLLNTNKGKFVLRILEGNRSFDSEKEELNFLLEVRKIIPCTVPYKTSDNETLIIYKNKMMSLFYFIDGKKLEETTPYYLQKIGTLLGKFHNFSLGKTLNRKTRIDEQYYFSKINIEDIPVSSEEKNKISQLCLKLKDTDFSKLPKGIIHSDIFPDNIFIKNNEIVGILDFNDAVTAPLIFDLGIVINYWIRINNWSKEKKKLYTEIFLTAYEEIRQLTEEEKKLLDMGTLKMALAFILLRMDRALIKNKPDILIEDKTYLELLPLLKYYK